MFGFLHYLRLSFFDDDVNVLYDKEQRQIDKRTFCKYINLLVVDCRFEPYQLISLIKSDVTKQKPIRHV